ncbi:hypothetical protein ANCDUO_06047 [Ancylostoma duodenale]|uniref:NTR domain-containing protein n=1 Tax=Ancylostoma duodenale TaxID=51022 RepID=A0A0C2H2I8_9BILA|nr:hypothetical protein ANCDUO_06047 [Ancylostoma duodenale]
MISLFVFIACLTAAHACTCDPPTVEKEYCSSNVDIVTWARVLSIDGNRTEIGGSLKYTIWHLITFKGYDKVKNNATSILTTPNSDGQCGVTNLEADCRVTEFTSQTAIL